MYTLIEQDGVKALQHNGKPCKCPFATRYIVPQGNAIAGMPPQFLENTGTCDSRCPGFEVEEKSSPFGTNGKALTVHLHCAIRRDITIGKTA